MKRAKVLLISPPKGLFAGCPEKPKFQTHPQGLLYIASILQKNKHYVEILDAWSFGLNLDSIKIKIIDFNPHIVGITAMTILAYDAYLVAKVVKEIDSKIVTVMGGPHATALPEEPINTDNIDIAVIGEGEYTMVAICNQVAQGGEDLSEIRGIVYKCGKKVIKTDHAYRIEQLDKIPFPAYHLLPSMADYNPPPHWGKKGKFASVITSRGCPYGCAFCCVSEAWGRKYRYRSPDNVVDELEFLNKKYSITFISFRDAVATLHKQRMIEICKGIIDRKLKMKWNCNAKAHEVDEELLRWMKKAGCKTIMYGIESGNEQILSQFKRADKKFIEQAINLTHKIGITPYGYFMFGLPGETKETMRETIDFAKSLKLHQAGFTSVIPFPGTKLWDYCINHNLILTTDWSKYDLKGLPPSKHLNLKAEEILRAQKTAFREFYMRPKVIFYQLKNIRSFNDLKNYILEALINLI